MAAATRTGATAAAIGRSQSEQAGNTIKPGRPSVRWASRGSMLSTRLSLLYPYCITDFSVGTRRMTLMVDRLSMSGMRGPISFSHPSDWYTAS